MRRTCSGHTQKSLCCVHECAICEWLQTGDHTMCEILWMLLTTLTIHHLLWSNVQMRYVPFFSSFGYLVFVVVIHTAIDKWKQATTKNRHHNRNTDENVHLRRCYAISDVCETVALLAWVNVNWNWSRVIRWQSWPSANRHAFVCIVVLSMIRCNMMPHLVASALQSCLMKRFVFCSVVLFPNQNNAIPAFEYCRLTNEKQNCIRNVKEITGCQLVDRSCLLS